VKKYLLDSNVFIQAHRMYYPFDVVPGFWNKLLALSNDGKIISLDKVKKELCESSTPDQLSEWCTGKVSSSFFVNSQECIDKYTEIADWVNSHPQYTQNAKDEFLATDLADPWLIAYAIKNDCIIVTHEISQPLAKKKIKIPEPGNHFNVRLITPIEMFRELGESF
jgi:hypothetical protein